MSNIPTTCVLAGIDFGDIYKAGVDQEYFGAISSSILIISQITALLFLIGVLHRSRGFSTAQSICVGIGVQCVITAVFAWLSVISVVFAADLKSYPSLTPPSYELVLYVEPDLRVNLLMAGLATFSLAWLMSYGAMRLLQVPPSERIRCSLIHAITMHPLIFPLNIVLGLNQTGRTNHPTDARNRGESPGAEKI